jgi:hypothetical protein
MSNYDIIYAYLAGGDVRDTEALAALNAMHLRITKLEALISALSSARTWRPYPDPREFPWLVGLVMTDEEYDLLNSLTRP